MAAQITRFLIASPSLLGKCDGCGNIDSLAVLGRASKPERPVLALCIRCCQAVGMGTTKVVEGVRATIGPA